MSPPNVTPSVTQRIETGWGRVYVTVNECDGVPCEVDVVTGQSGGLYNAQSEAIAKICSDALDSGTNIETLAESLIGIRSGRIATDNGDNIHSIPDAVGVALLRYTSDRLGHAVKDEEVSSDGTVLP